MPAYRFYLFGVPRLEYKNKPVSIDTRKALALLAYLGVHKFLGTKLDESEHTVGEDFQAAGYRTGVFTSPHLVRPNERIRLADQIGRAACRERG